MEQHSVYEAALARLSELGGELITAALSDLPHGDRFDTIMGVLRRIEDAGHELKHAFDNEMPYLPKGGKQ